MPPDQTVKPESPGASSLWYDSPSWGDGELATIGRPTGTNSPVGVRAVPP